MRAPLGNSEFKLLLGPLHLAAISGHGAIVKVLLDQGADPNIMDNFRSTPLQAAVSGSHEAVVKLLLGRGADINHSNVFGRTPLREAVIRKQRCVQDLILEHMELLGMAPSKSDLEFDASDESVRCAICNNCAIVLLANEEFYQCMVCKDLYYVLCLQCVGLFMDCPRGHLLTKSYLGNDPGFDEQGSKSKYSAEEGL